MKLEQWIAIEAEAHWMALTEDGLIEHATACRAIDGERLDSKTDYPASELIHDH